MAMKAISRIRAHTANVSRVTTGLKDSLIEKFSHDPRLNKCIEDAEVALEGKLKEQGGSSFIKDEAAMFDSLQEGYCNFYHPHSIMPQIPLAAKGPWIVTLHGAVIHDSGGYGMLGFGHNPDFLMDAVGSSHCMANVMTPSFSQAEFMKAIRKSIGWSRGGCPFDQFVCMNSGSEAVEFSARLTDVDAKLKTQKGGVHEGRRVQMMSMKGGFYGRTYRPARLSESCRDTYREHLASFQYPECHMPIAVEPNNVEDLERAFAYAEENNIHIEACYLEPVMGEGKPGEIMTKEFYKKARELTKKHHSILIADCIQASLRATGSLSICDYPGFEDVDAPDMETYSKALNAGQYPLSVLAIQQHVADVHVPGLYGNTMTTNPRALDIGATVLNAVTPQIRENILDKGIEMQELFTKISKEHPAVFAGATGSGLLQAIHLSKDMKMFGGNQPGSESVLARCRMSGLGVINAAHTVKFTPHFELESDEIELMGEVLRDVAKSYS